MKLLPIRCSFFVFFLSGGQGSFLLAGFSRIGRLDSMLIKMVFFFFFPIQVPTLTTSRGVFSCSRGSECFKQCAVRPLTV
ncbi:hypothetical protein GGR50DRAFT_657765 [Xylaria sp. CBS 124048]|nr:hypothetical protein GGR50DRAFT_657765 [Xylaria sp. CBS 124048]